MRSLPILQEHLYKLGIFNIQPKLEKTIPEPMFENRAIVVTKTSLKSAPSDVAYWRDQLYAARLAALEMIHREFHQWKYHAEPGFQRVYTVIDLENLKINKKASGRLQDLADLENLGGC